MAEQNNSARETQLGEKIVKHQSLIKVSVDLLKLLIRDNCLTEREKYEILQMDDERLRVAKLLKILQSLPASHCPWTKLTNALQNTEQSDICELLKDTGRLWTFKFCQCQKTGVRLLQCFI